MKSSTLTKKWLLDLLFPKHCLGCQKLDTLICRQCFSKIPISPRLICSACSHPLSGLKKHRHCLSQLKGLFIASQWQSQLLKTLIYQFKYNFVKELALPLGQLLVKALTKSNFWRGVHSPLLLPIPIHCRRLHWRGFNQAELLCQQIRQEFHWPVVVDLLQRGRYRKPQMTLDNIQLRYSNIKGVFVLNPKLENELWNLSKRTIFLVDDVCTSGATLEEAASCLRQKIPGLNIYGLVLARA